MSRGRKGAYTCLRFDFATVSIIVLDGASAQGSDVMCEHNSELEELDQN